MKTNRFLLILTIILLFSFVSIFAQQEKIIHTSNRSGNWDIWTCSPDGSNHEQLTYTPWHEGSPRVSPDGTKIAYGFGGDGYASGLRIMNRDGTNSHQIADGEIPSICWSPDGTKVLFSVNTGLYRGHIRIININEPYNDHEWLMPTAPYTLVYPRDWKNDKILYSACHGHSGNYRVFIINDDKTNSEQIIFENGQLPRFSPDASKIAYLNIGSWGGRLKLMDIDSRMSKILHSGSLPEFLCFSPNGNEIAFGERFVSNQRNNLVTINIDGTGYTQITHTNDISGANDWVYWGEQTLAIAVDIKPGSYPNPLNVKSKGVLPVAILGALDFNVNDIDVSSIELEGVSPTRFSFEDVGASIGDLENPCHSTCEGSDGLMDLSLKFNTQDIVAILGDCEDGDEIVLTATGELLDGTSIEGNDCIVILAKGKLKKPMAYNGDIAPVTFNLSQNYPNPFNPSTTIKYSIPSECNVKLDIYNYNGQKIEGLINGIRSAGFYETQWTANVASGVYFYRFEANPIDNSQETFIEIKKITLTR